MSVVLFNILKKGYRDRIPQDEQASISFYKMMNYRNVGKCHPRKADYDLMTLAIIRLGNRIYQNQEKSVLDFLIMIFYPHADSFRGKVSKYISFEIVLGEEEEKNMIDFKYCFYATGKTTMEIAEALEEPEDAIQALCEKAVLYAPE